MKFLIIKTREAFVCWELDKQNHSLNRFEMSLYRAWSGLRVPLYYTWTRTKKITLLCKVKYLIILRRKHLRTVIHHTKLSGGSFIFGHSIKRSLSKVNRNLSLSYIGDTYMRQFARKKLSGFWVEFWFEPKKTLSKSPSTIQNILDCRRTFCNRVEHQIFFFRYWLFGQDLKYVRL